LLDSSLRVGSLVKINLRESEMMDLSGLECEVCVIFLKGFENEFRGKVCKTMWVIWMMWYRRNKVLID